MNHPAETSTAEPKTVRTDRILDAAAVLIIRHGVDKTTMSDVAAAAGVGRGVLYLHFASKDHLLDALVDREVMAYARSWHEHIVADPGIHSVGGIYRAVSQAINSRPLMVAMMKRDRQIFGAYLHWPNSRFAAIQGSSFGVGTLRAMQASGAVRADVDPEVMSYVMDLISYGLARAGDAPMVAAPPLPVVLETIADMLDRMLTPPGGGDPAAGRAVIVEMARLVQHQLEEANHRVTR